MDYYPQITAASRLIADFVGSGDFQIKTRKGAPRWNRTAGWLEISEEVFSALRRRGWVVESAEPGYFRTPRSYE